jgi:hypothetical protein
VTSVTQFLDSIPTIAIYVLIVGIMFVAYEIGYRVGRWREDRSPEEKEGPTSMLVGALLALMAFLLAITFGLAGDRFDARRQLVIQEANAIQTAYLKAGYVPGPEAQQVRALLREYPQYRMTSSDPEQQAANTEKSRELGDQMWALTQTIGQNNLQSDAISAYIDAMNEVINLREQRVTAVNARVPEAVLIFLFVGSVLAIGLVGYDAGLTMKRSFVAALVLVILFGATIALVFDINQPASGLVTVSQQPLVDVQQLMERNP